MYRIVTHAHARTLAKEVCHLMARGWVVVGGVTNTPRGLAQAMVHPEGQPGPIEELAAEIREMTKQIRVHGTEGAER